MILKSLVLAVFLMVSFIGTSQVSLNEYKYIVVPKRFDGFKKENMHQTSTLTAHLFAKKGFSTVYDDNLPLDLAADRCLGLYVNLVNNSSMFTTKTSLVLKDCSNQEVFLTQEGKSKKKDYKASYNEAITNAFNSIAVLKYVYEPKTAPKEEEMVTISFDNDVKKLEDQPELKNNQDTMIEQVATEDVQSYKDNNPVQMDKKQTDLAHEREMIKQTATKEEQSFKSMEPVQTDIPVPSSQSVSAASGPMGILYAQELPNGYQLVDSTPKIQLKIFKSSMPNVYIAKSDSKDGVVYTSDGKWFFEYQEGDQIVKEELNIKF